ncbi:MULTISPECIES: FxsA family protein [unclassified Azospirillum]|jgi:UPF0716 protein FxsA|uniref:FxsA family protein n=1 Tax=unclassified Azospirillum TaxID=2630922 RepID=UPI000B763582|nr:MULTISPECIES: FxsA family protein [unclassified Azospirillum]SNS63208.1 UPF0716 protein FxsA [Azospirillum sp. RU38E]SNS82336.1 UPF0716 protein FxsA [Azospirillum sp. RU37A]
MRFLLPLLLLPLIEIAGFAWVGSQIGALNTVLLVLLSGVLGILLLQRQGLGALRKAQGRLQQGQPPLQEAFDGLCLALAGILLLIPGFLTDILALLLFLPPVRQAMFRRMGKLMQEGKMHMSASATNAQGTRRTTTVIDADYVEVQRPGPAAGDNTADLPPPDSRWRPPGNQG